MTRSSTVSQPNRLPTRKLTASTVGAALIAVAQVITQNLFPEWDEPYLWAALTPLAAYVAGYFVRDKANT